MIRKQPTDEIKNYARSLDDFFLILNPCTAKLYGGTRAYPLFIEVQYAHGRLTLCGVAGPLPSGNARGGSGQLRLTDYTIGKYSEG